MEPGDEDDFQALLRRGWGSGDFDGADPVLVLRPQDPSGGPLDERGAINAPSLRLRGPTRAREGLRREANNKPSARAGSDR